MNRISQTVCRLGLMALLGLVLPAGAAVVSPGVDAAERLREALTLVQPGEVVELAAGVFRLNEPLLVGVDSTVLRGMGRDRTILIFHPQAGADSGLSVRADSVHLEGFAVQNAAGTAIWLEGVSDISIRDVRVQWDSDWGESEAVGRSGLVVSHSQGVQIESLHGSGASVAGILIQDSVQVLVHNAVLEANSVGLMVEESSQVEVLASRMQNNGVGMLLRDLPQGEAVRHVRLFNNEITDNNNFGFAVAGVGMWSEALPVGTGLFVGGARDVEIFGNTLSNHGTANILVTTIPPAHFPARIYIHSNSMGRSGYAPDLQRAGQIVAAANGRLASITWDGIVPWYEMVWLKPRVSRVMLGNNGDADFIDLQLSWFKMLPALHSPNRNYIEYAGTGRPLPPVYLGK